MGRLLQHSTPWHPICSCKGHRYLLAGSRRQEAGSSPDKQIYSQFQDIPSHWLSSATLPWTYLRLSGFPLLLWLRGHFYLHWGPSLAFPISCPLGLCLGPLSRLHHPGPPPLPCVCSASSTAPPKPLGQPQNPPHAPPNALLGLLSRPMCTLPAPLLCTPESLVSTPVSDHETPLGTTVLCSQVSS